jgi:NAD(P)-dependent dehydrogenase (short-subunit alcohol dehydrogenase family)
VKAIAAAALDALGGLDILVNSAGGASGFPQGTASIPDEEWQAGFALNLFAAIYLWRRSSLPIPRSRHCDREHRPYRSDPFSSGFEYPARTQKSEWRANGAGRVYPVNIWIARLPQDFEKPTQVLPSFADSRGRTAFWPIPPLNLDYWASR